MKVATFWSGPISNIMRGRAVQIFFGRSAGPVVAMNIAPGPLVIRTATARERFRNAVIEALRRHCAVRSFSSVRELIAAARAPAPQPEARALLH